MFLATISWANSALHPFWYQITWFVDLSVSLQLFVSSKSSSTKHPKARSFSFCLFSHLHILPMGACCACPLYHCPKSSTWQRKGRGAAATCSRITYKHVQRCGVIEELLREVAVARGPGAACPHGLGEVLLHQHGGQRDGLKPRHGKAVGDEPVHQSGTCGGEKGSSQTEGTRSSKGR